MIKAGIKLLMFCLLNNQLELVFHTLKIFLIIKPVMLRLPTIFSISLSISLKFSANSNPMISIWPLKVMEEFIFQQQLIELSKEKMKKVEMNYSTEQKDSLLETLTQNGTNNKVNFKMIDFNGLKYISSMVFYHSMFGTE